MLKNSLLSMKVMHPHKSLSSVLLLQFPYWTNYLIYLISSSCSNILCRRVCAQAVRSLSAFAGEKGQIREDAGDVVKIMQNSSHGGRNY